MAVSSLTHDNDTLATIAWNYTNKNLLNLLTKEGETLIPELARRGRIFAVPDTEQMTQPFYYADPGDTTYAATTVGEFGPGATVGVTSAEFCTQLAFTHVEWQNNVIWPTSMPGGTDLNFHMARAAAKRAAIFNMEEALLVRGGVAITTDYAPFPPHSGDDSYNAANPMSLLGLYTLGTTTSGIHGDIDATDEKFAGVIVDNVVEFEPTKTITTAANGADLLQDLMLAQGNASYGAERPNYITSGFKPWAKVASLTREFGAVPMPASADVVHNPNQSITIMGIPYVWTRFLADADKEWDFTTGQTNGTSQFPILLLNLNSLRMNVPVNGGEVDGLNYIRKASTVQVQEAKTQSYYRIIAKRSYSLDNGRRSFGAVEGITLA